MVGFAARVIPPEVCDRARARLTALPRASRARPALSPWRSSESMLLRPKCQQQHDQIEVALGDVKVFGRLTFGLNDLQISREQGALRAAIDGSLELTSCGAGRMRVLRVVAGAPSLVNTPPYMAKGERVALQPGDEIQLLVAKREEGQPKAVARDNATGGAWIPEPQLAPCRQNFAVCTSSGCVSEPGV